MLTYSYSRVLGFVCLIFLVVKHFHLLCPISMIIVAVYFLFFFLCCVVVAPYYYIVAYSGLHISKKTNKQATLPASHCPQNVSPSVKSILLEAAICLVLPSGLRDVQCGPNEDEEIPDLDFAEACNFFSSSPTAAVCCTQASYETGAQDCSVLSARQSAYFISCASVLHLGAHV